MAAIFVGLFVVPHAWRRWVDEGDKAVARLRRRVAKQLVVSKEDQIPAVGSQEGKALKSIYDYFSSSSSKKHRFEALAADITARVLRSSGDFSYTDGWITQGSGDHGLDFVGRLDVGTGFAKTKLVVLGQAKCEKLSVPTGGNHIARTVARLKRGWIGVYVTTSFYSKPVQEEIVEDAYPLVLIHGKRLANEVLAAALEQSTTVDKFLKAVDDTYRSRLARRRPEEVLLM